MQDAMRSEQRPRAKVLIISDDPVNARVWGYSLNQVGVDVHLISIIDPVIQVWTNETPDLIIIEDFNVEIEELAICKELRAETVVPILYMTSKTDEAFAMEVYRAGADECIPFPISPRLFQAKVNAWLRRTMSIPLAAIDEVKAGSLRLSVDRRQLWKKNGEAVRLTVLETRLLYLLMSHPGRLFETDQIVDRVWGYYGNGDSRLLKNLVYRLRRKIEQDPARPKHILTDSNHGYKFEANGNGA